MPNKKKHKKEKINNIEEENTTENNNEFNEIVKEEIDNSIVEDITTNNEVENVLTDNIDDNRDKVNNYKTKSKKNYLTTLLLIVVLLLSLLYFFSSLINKQVNDLTGIISLLTIVLFSISFVVVGISIDIKKKGLFSIGALCLIIFYLINISGKYLNINGSVQVIDFRGMSLTEVMKWASSNKVEIEQEYEYSDMVPEYQIISQSVVSGTKLKDVNKLVVAISEGPSPYKEIILPNMVSWETTKVINFVESNYLTNVNVEFVESGEKQDTVIEQDKVGNVKRNEEINLVFSLGEEINYEEKFKLIDFTNKSKFETTLYLKQHHLGFMFKDDFSKDVKKDLVMDQSISPGETVKANDWIAITLSKGPEIKVPDLTKMTSQELSKWIIRNKLKVKFSDQYDSNVKKNGIISVNYKKGDIISQGTVVEVVLSKGQLKMPKFKTFYEFTEWANKYGVKYEEQREFSTTVKAGEIISFSINKGEVIKNDDVIIVKVSDGEKTTVPDLSGLTKKEVENMLSKLGLNYNFIYRANNNVAEGKVVSQSISAGSDVSSGTTITVTISTGKETTSNNSSRSNNNSSSNYSTPTPAPAPTPNTCDSSIGAELNIQTGSTGAQTRNIISGMNPNHKISYSFVTSCPNGDTTPGTVCSVSGGGDGVWVSYCTPITIVIIQ